MTIVAPMTTLIKSGEHIGSITAREYMAGLVAIEEQYTRDRAALKARWPMRPSKFPPDAKRAFAALDEAREAAIVALETAYNADAA